MFNVAEQKWEEFKFVEHRRNKNERQEAKARERRFKF